MLTEQGFKRLRYNDYLVIMEGQARELFGADVNLSERSPLGMFIKLQAMARAEDNELAEDVYFSAQVKNSTGVSLDAAVKYAGLTRIQAKKATNTGPVILNLDAFVTIPKGAIVGTKDNIKFVTTSEVISSDPGNYNVNIQAVEFGEIGNVPANTITEIFTPYAGWHSVNNPEPTNNGQDKETDEELRERYFNGGLSLRGSTTVDSIRAALLDEVEGVRAAIVLENESDTTNGDGIPPHSIYPIVLGGTQEEVARKVYEKKAGGIRSYGSTQVGIIDDMGETHPIGFDYATNKPIYVNASITTNDRFPTNGDDLVIAEILKYIGGTDDELNQYNGLGMGQTVVQSKVESVCFRIEGVEDVNVQLSTDGETYASDNIQVSRFEVAETDTSKVVIAHV